MGGSNDVLDDFLKDMLSVDSDALDVVVDALEDAIPPATPSPGVRSRLMQTIAAGGRLHRFADEVARILRIGTDKAKSLLDGIDLAASWFESPIDNAAIYHLEGHTPLTNAIVGFIRVRAGTSFPPHSHIGEEFVLVLEGRYREQPTGKIYEPGDVHAMPGGDDEHAFDVLPGPDLVILSIVEGGLRTLGTTYLPGDERL